MRIFKRFLLLFSFLLFAFSIFSSSSITQAIMGGGMFPIFGENFSSQDQQSNIGSIAAPPAITIHGHAFLSNSAAAADTRLTLFVVVQDGNNQPVEGAMIGAVINLPSGRKEIFRLQPTDETGISRLQFTSGPVPINKVIPIDVEISYKRQETRTSCWFRSWW